jgi:hypothetical protein
VKHSLVAATSARGKVHEHEPHSQPPNLTKFREGAVNNIKTAPLIPLLLGKQIPIEPSLPESHTSEDSVVTPTSRLQAWLEESDEFEYQATRLQRRHTTSGTPSQFVWSKRLQPATSQLSDNDKEDSSNSLCESTGTSYRASGNTTDARGLSRWNKGSQSLQEPTTPVEVQTHFLKSILESGIPLIPQAKLEIEAEAAPQRPVVTFATLPKMEGRLQVRQPEMSGHKAKAVDDARQAQAAVNEMCRLAGRSPPRWALCELIGKGSYGRVYMG